MTSDIDRIGVFLAPTQSILGIWPIEESVVQTHPDVTLHEVGKFVRLALKANPTILELLWLDAYDILEPPARLLIEHRDAFVSKRVYKSYGGYAHDQALKLKARGDTFSSTTRNRTSKHARHCLRLLQQGSHLLRTGEIQVRVDDPDDLLAFGQLPVPDILERFDREYEAFMDLPSDLPNEPDTDLVNSILLQIREQYG